MSGQHGRADFASLARAYRELDVPERQRLAETGARATSRYRLKRKRGVAFGRPVSAAMATNKAAFAKAQRQRLALLPLDAQLERIRQSAIGAGSAIVASTMKQARALVRAEAASQRLELAAIDARLPLLLPLGPGARPSEPRRWRCSSRSLAFPANTHSVASNNTR